MSRKRSPGRHLPRARRMPCDGVSTGRPREPSSGGWFPKSDAWRSGKEYRSLPARRRNRQLSPTARRTRLLPLVPTLRVGTHGPTLRVAFCRRRCQGEWRRRPVRAFPRRTRAAVEDPRLPPSAAAPEPTNRVVATALPSAATKPSTSSFAHVATNELSEAPSATAKRPLSAAPAKASSYSSGALPRLCVWKLASARKERWWAWVIAPSGRRGCRCRGSE